MFAKVVILGAQKLKSLSLFKLAYGRQFRVMDTVKRKSVRILCVSFLFHTDLEIN